MTNFEKMKPALDMIFNDLDVDEFVTFLGEAYGGISCSFCKLKKRCNHMMGYDDPDHDEKYPFGTEVTCEDVLRSFLEEDSEIVHESEEDIHARGELYTDAEGNEYVRLGCLPWHSGRYPSKEEEVKE